MPSSCRTLLCVLLTSLAVVFISPNILASSVDNATLSISPLLTELNTSPGRTERFDIEVRNEGLVKEARFKVWVASVDTLPNGDYKLSSADTDRPYSAAPWITASPSDLTVRPREAALINVEVKVPRTERHGGRYAAIIIDLEPDAKSDAEANTSIALRYRMVSLVELTVGNRFTKKAHISNMQVVPASGLGIIGVSLPKTALAFSASLTNDGPIHVLGKGEVIIRNASGRLVGKMPLGQGRGAVWPGATLDFLSIVPTGLPPGDYTIQAMIEYGGLRPAITKTTFTVEDSSVKGGAASRKPVVRFDAEPENLTVELPEGALRGEYITLTNLHEKSIQVAISMSPLIYDSQGELAIEMLNESAKSIEWLDISPMQLTLQPNERRRIRLIIMNDASIAGANYGLVTFTASEVNGTTGSLIAEGISTDMGTTVFMIPKENIQRNAEVASIDLIMPGADNPFGVTVKVANTGNIHIKAQATMILERLDLPKVAESSNYIGKPTYVQVWRGPLPADVLKQILPGENRLITGYVTEQLAAGEYRLTVMLDYGGSAPTLMQREFTISGVAIETAKE